MNYKRSDYAGGIAKMYLVPAAAAASIRRELVSGSYLMPGLSSYLIPVQFAIDSGRFTVTNKLGAWQIRIEAFIPSSLAIDSLAFFSQWVGKPFNILVQDYNGNYIYFGNRDNFFIYRPQFSSAQDFSEASGFSFNLQRDMLVPPIHIVSPFLRQAPEALVVRIPVYPSENKEVTGTYEYRSFDDRPESGSVYAWHLADTSTGPKTAIPGETAITFTPLAEHVGKFLFFSVIPSDGSLQGRQVFSNPAYILAAADAPSDYQGPEALNARIVGTPVVGNSLSIVYQYLDSEDNEEFGTTFQWHSMAAANSTTSKIVGTAKDLILSAGMKNKYIFAILTPASASGIGNAVRIPSSGGLKVLGRTLNKRLNPADLAQNVVDPRLRYERISESGEPDVYRITNNAATSQVGAATTFHNIVPLNIPKSSNITVELFFRTPSTLPSAINITIRQGNSVDSPYVYSLDGSVNYDRVSNPPEYSQRVTFNRTNAVTPYVGLGIGWLSYGHIPGDYIDILHIDISWEE